MYYCAACQPVGRGTLEPWCLVVGLYESCVWSWIFTINFVARDAAGRSLIWLRRIIVAPATPRTKASSMKIPCRRALLPHIFYMHGNTASRPWLEAFVIAYRACAARRWQRLLHGTSTAALPFASVCSARLNELWAAAHGHSLSIFPCLEHLIVHPTLS